MKANSGKFWRWPVTRLGQWAGGLSLLFVVVFLLKTTNLIPFFFPGMLVMAHGIVGFALVLSALIWKRERSWVLWLMLLPGLFAIYFSLGEILYPH